MSFIFGLLCGYRCGTALIGFSKLILCISFGDCIGYLNDAVPTITCSRSALAPLKFWWQIHKTGFEGYRHQAELILKNAAYLKERLDEIGYPAWKNEFSNTVYFRRPGDKVMEKWGLAPNEDARLGGKLAHDVVMRHEGRHLIDQFVEDIVEDLEQARQG